MNHVASAAAAAIICTQNCGDCNGKGEVHMVGETWPCPSCHTEEYEAVARFRGLNPATEA